MLRQGKISEAQALCMAVLDNDSSNADAWYLLSSLQLRARSYGAAAESARRACQIAPARPEILIQFGTCLGASGRIRDAMATGERAADLEPTSAAHLSNLGTLFSMCGDHARAAQCFDRATRADSANASYWFNFATSLRALGETKQAESACNNAIELDPGDGQARYLRSDLRIQSPESNHIAELQRVLSVGELNAESRILCGFALAKELEDLEDYRASFQTLTAAATAYRDSIKYDVSNDIAVIDAIISMHTRDSLQVLESGYKGAAPIFIVGLPRSGTTLVERIIQGHSQVKSVGERNDFARELSRLVSEKCNRSKLTRLELVDNSLQISMLELGTEYVDRIHEAENSAPRLVDKMPINYLYCGLISAALPNAKIIALQRNPMDTCYAAYKAFLRGPYSFTYNLEELGRYYLAYRRLTEHWSKTIGKDAYFEVNYESLVTNFEIEARRLIQFLNLSWEDGVLDFQSSKVATGTASAVQVRRGIYSTSIDRWKHYATELQPLRQVLQQAIDV